MKNLLGLELIMKKCQESKSYFAEIATVRMNSVNGQIVTWKNEKIVSRKDNV